jgi:neopullulanase
MNNGKFDGAKLTNEQAALREYYKAIMALNSLPAVVGGDMQKLNLTGSDRIVGFSRTLGQQTILVLSNFSDQTQSISVDLSQEQVTKLGESSLIVDLLEQHQVKLKTHSQGATFNLTLDAFSSAVLTNKANNE